MNNTIMKNLFKERASSMTESIREFSTQEIKGIRIRIRLWNILYELLQRIHEHTLKIISGMDNISVSLDTVNKSQRHLEEKIINPNPFIKMISDDITSLSIKTEITARNLQQTRLLVERVSERVDSISQYFIDRQVIEPISKDFGSFYNLLRAMKQTNEVDIDDLLEQYYLILKSIETEVIEPQDGASLNALEHQPIKKIKTQNPHQDKTINSTIRGGLKFKGRVIQRAQVAVYVFNNNSEIS